MKTTRIIIGFIILVFCIPSCDKPLKTNNVMNEYDFYSITLFQMDESQIYLRLKSNTDSLFIIKDKGSISEQKKSFFK